MSAGNPADATLRSGGLVDWAYTIRELAEKLGKVEDTRRGLRPAATRFDCLHERGSETCGVLRPGRCCLLELALNLEHHGAGRCVGRRRR